MTKRRKLYKVLELNNHSGLVSSPYQHRRYNHLLPKNGKPGKWSRQLKGKPVVCVYGWHLTSRPERHISPDSPVITSTDGQAIRLRVSVVYEAQGRGKVHGGRKSKYLKQPSDKRAFQSIRLLREVPRSRWHKAWLQRINGYAFGA